MEDLAVLPHPDFRERESRVRVLLADGDAGTRSLLASRARDTVAAIVVLEARDGPEAIQLGLQHQPQIALLDAAMPRLGGIDVATTLRELQPRMRLAVHAADPHGHRDRARAHRLPLFDKRELARALGWLEVQARSCAQPEGRQELLRKRSLGCSSCRYGIYSLNPPERCPMCQARNGWIGAPRRPFQSDL